jgi:aryl-alcohol dehydrogenase-like predicted oxidoreductase
MEYTTLGNTGTTVSRICLGCMSFGSKDWRGWVLEDDDATEIIEWAIDLGINFFDTANMYSTGESERLLGEALEGRREESVVATKVFFRMRGDDPNSQGLSRKTIEQELEASLDRLGMDTVDLYQIHRWDEHTPPEETLRTLDDTVRRGQTRCIGASSMWAYQFARMLRISDVEGLERFATMQPHYNLCYRERERDLLPMCEEEGIGVVPWSPLARGYLTRPHEEFESSDRPDADGWLQRNPYDVGAGREINKRVEQLAEDEGVTMAQIALAWLLHKNCVTAPIVGTTSVEHLEDAVEALEISLSDSDLEYLEEPYEPVEAPRW